LFLLPLFGTINTFKLIISIGRLKVVEQIEGGNFKL
jgi:hypothetical protein